MSDFEKLQAQIEAQILNMYTFDIVFTDCKNEAFRLIHSDDGFYVWPLFFKPKKITRAKAQILIKLATDFIKDSDVREFDLDSKLTYDEFMDEFFNSTTLSLTDHIMINHDDNNAAFARKNNVLPQQVTEWKNKGFVVVDGKLYSPRRELEI
mgnify:CR=1 FL=1